MGAPPEVDVLGSSSLVAMVPSTDLARAQAFFVGVLGLRVVAQDGFALVLDANGATLRVTNVASVPGFAPAPFAIVGWLVDDIQQIVRNLQGRGVRCARFEGMPQDDLGIWLSPSGARVAWFRDPDGNVLSITQP